MRTEHTFPRDSFVVLLSLSSQGAPIIEHEENHNIHNADYHGQSRSGCQAIRVFSPRLDQAFSAGLSRLSSCSRRHPSHRAFCSQCWPSLTSLSKAYSTASAAPRAFRVLLLEALTEL